MTSVTLDSLESFRLWVFEFAKTLQGNEIILLRGPMGAGKTEFVKQLSVSMDSCGEKASVSDSDDGTASINTADIGVTSPTYSFHHQYRRARAKAMNSNSMSEKNLNLVEIFSIDHWDLYRLRSPEELESIGFWDQLEQATGIACIEWPERLGLSGAFTDGSMSELATLGGSANRPVIDLEIQADDHEIRRISFRRLP